ITEASYLATGYANYSREVLSKLCNKYDVFEIGCYAHPHDPRINSIPWQIFPNVPATEEERNIYNSNIFYQFGEWRFEQVCLTCVPDIVMLFRDHWMDAFVYNSPYRKCYSIVHMPTVDARPQN